MKNAFLKNEKKDSNYYDIVIVGGGITGLSALFELNNLVKNSINKISIILLESSNQTGGKISTDSVATIFGNFILENGPDSFLTAKPWGLKLVEQLQLNEEIIQTNECRTVFVLKKGQLVKMPEGMMLMVPTKIWPFIVTKLFSFWGKVRAAFELFIIKSKSENDESVYNFVQRRFGKEMLAYLAEPLLSGIYNADPKKQSLRATFPQFAQIEKDKGSLIRGFFLSKTKKNKQSSPFISFKNGMQTLIEALVQHTGALIKTNTSLKNIRPIEEYSYELILNNDQIIKTKYLILTTPASVSAQLLQQVSNSAAKELAKLRTVWSGCVYFAFKKTEVKRNLNGLGILIPEVENRAINAITWTSNKFAYRAPPGTVLLRVFFGGSRNPSIMSKTDAQIIAITLEEACRIMEIDAQPIFSRIYRGNHENPQYDVEHLNCITAIKKALPDNIDLAGSAFSGVGIPDCVNQGFIAANKAVQTVLSNYDKTL